MKIVGLEHKAKFTERKDLERLRYGKVSHYFCLLFKQIVRFCFQWINEDDLQISLQLMIMTDQDQDGSHINLVRL